tara:strand:- start:1110 stop:1484 length:375 start_codon:yes stop_codon:yes gene_type:complete
LALDVPYTQYKGVPDGLCCAHHDPSGCIDASNICKRKPLTFTGDTCQEKLALGKPFCQGLYDASNDDLSGGWCGVLGKNLCGDYYSGMINIKDGDDACMMDYRNITPNRLIQSKLIQFNCGAGY